MPDPAAPSGLELFVLAALSRLGNDAYGLTIRTSIAEETGRDIAVGSIYRVLAALERKRLVRSWRGEPTRVRGGRAKRHFELTPEGATLLQDTLRDLSSLVGARIVYP